MDGLRSHWPAPEPWSAQTASTPRGQSDPTWRTEPSAGPLLRVVELNSLLTGGGTDDRGLNVVRGLMWLGHQVCLAGPEGRDYSRRAQAAGVRLCPLPTGGLLRWRFILAAAKLLRRQQPQIVQARHGRDYWPAVLAV